MTNARTGIELTQALSAREPFLAFTGQNAEWIVEDFADSYPDQYGLIPFANFGSITFTNCEAIANNATTAAWDQIYPTAANTINQPLVQNGTYLTSLSFPGTNEVKVTYI
jgi:hypothetical protein